MEFKLDENLPPSAAYLLRGLGRAPHLQSVLVAGRLWIADEHRIRVRQVGEIDLGPEVREVPFT